MNRNGTILAPDSPEACRALALFQKLFIANKEFLGVSAIDWKLAVFDAEHVNAIALLVNLNS